MILLHSCNQKSKLQIVSLIQSQTPESIVIAETHDEIVGLARKHRPQTIFIFLPKPSGLAVDIQYYVREKLPHARVRILPYVYGTEQLLEGWQAVVTKALCPRGTGGRKKTETQS
jgi:hypothetical protein